MAGGRGTRLGSGEKPLVRIGDTPMLARVLSSFRDAGHEPIVVLSDAVPVTRNWCRAWDQEYINTPGKGYVEDLNEAAEILRIPGSFFCSVSDIPCILPETLKTIESVYGAAGTPALSVWIPEFLVSRFGGKPTYSMEVEGVLAVPTGVNIFHGAHIGVPCDEVQLLLNASDLALNVNTPNEVLAAEKFLKNVREKNVPGIV